MSAGELARALGEHMRLTRIGRAWTLEQSAKAAGVPAEAVHELEAGRGSLQDFLAVAAAYGIAHELWNSTRPRARSLDEMERIEMAIIEQNARGSSTAG